MKNNIERIIALEAEHDSNRWEVASLYAAECATQSQRAVAKLVGKSHQHVGRMVAVWEEFGTLECHPDFNEAYQALAHKPEQDQQVRPAGRTSGSWDTDDMAEAIRSTPAVAAAAREALISLDPPLHPPRRDAVWDIREEAGFLANTSGKLRGRAQAMLQVLPDLAGSGDLVVYEWEIGDFESMWSIYVKVATGVVTTTEELGELLAEHNRRGDKLVS